MKNYSAVTEPKDIATKEYVDGQDNTKQQKINVNGILKGTGSGGVAQAVANTDYLSPENGDSRYLKLSGGTLTGNLTGQVFSGTKLKTTSADAKDSVNTLAVIDSDGSICKRDVSTLPQPSGGASTYLASAQPSGAKTGDVWYKIL